VNQAPPPAKQPNVFNAETDHALAVVGGVAGVVLQVGPNARRELPLHDLALPKGHCQGNDGNHDGAAADD